jgi:serine/threonine protein phosphatase PrpC
MRFTIFQDSRLGDRRENQDRVGYAYGRNRLLMVLADGMGGHLQGEIAAQIAVAEILRLFEREAGPRLARPAGFLVALLQAAHRAIAAYAAAHALPESPRTTCVACIVQDGTAWWAHAGDSRLYLLRGGHVAAATRDHSRVQQLLDAGLISPAAAAVHPGRNRIYSGLGGDEAPIIDAGGGTALVAGDTLLLSSDGFWSQHPPDDIAAKLKARPLLELMPALLTEAQLLARGSSDNLSVVAMTWESREEAHPPGPPAGGRHFTAVGDTTWPGGPGRPAGASDAAFDRAIGAAPAAPRKDSP